MNSTFQRREFLKILGAGTSYLAITSPLFGLNACKKNVSSDDLFFVFRKPPSEAKPFYRWWWNGNRVTKDEVKRELEVMKNAGAGGVEINPIALNPAVKNPSAEALTWLSDEWVEVLKAAIEKGDELGMISDMIVGTGWPFGGKFLADEETIQGHDLYTEKIEGPIMYTFNTSNLKEGAVIKQAKLVPVPVSNEDAITDITAEIQNGSVPVPAGDFEISVISWRNKFREVMHGAPGGDGPV